VTTHSQTEPAVALFGALCGATSAEPPMPPYAIHFYTTFLSKLYASVGAPSAAERAAGRHRLKLEPAVAVVEACLDGCLDPAEHAKLLGRLKIHADGEGADAHIDLGACVWRRSQPTSNGFPLVPRGLACVWHKRGSRARSRDSRHG
jgi:hypothetical protein